MACGLEYRELDLEMTGVSVFRNSLPLHHSQLIIRLVNAPNCCSRKLCVVFNTDQNDHDRDHESTKLFWRPPSTDITKELQSRLSLIEYPQSVSSSRREDHRDAITFSFSLRLPGECTASVIYAGLKFVHAAAYAVPHMQLILVWSISAAVCLSSCPVIMMRWRQKPVAVRWKPSHKHVRLSLSCAV